MKIFQAQKADIFIPEVPVVIIYCFVFVYHCICTVASRLCALN